jgi:DNA-binding response OmpR family regulator
MHRRILIAEDVPDINQLLMQIATRYGYDAVSVPDGVELLTVTAKEKFDVIITDVKMPNLDGASASQIMKLIGDTTPIIALTALSPQEMELAMDRFAKVFYKPYDVRELFAYIKTLIG